MKPYFAKYLPVEGEIKHGDLYFFDEEACKRLKVSIGTVGRANTEAFGQPPYHYLYDKKAKLFLCSRDIKDIKVDFDQQQWQEMSRKEKDEYLLHTNQYKVIGEISSEATWAKEGDEFDEDEIYRNHICHDSPGNTGYCFHCGRSKGCDSEDYNYLIKGPCGHFH